MHKRVEAPPDREGRRAVLDTTRFFWDGQRLVHELTRRSRPDHAGAAPRVAATTAAQGDPFAGIASPDPAQSPVEATTPAASKTELRTYCHEDGSYALVAGKLPDGRWAFYVNDAVGTPEALVAADGTVLGSLERHAWRMEEAGGLTPFRFPGQYEDEETGLCYNRYRYYDPELGRFISADPVGLRGGTNVFSYAPNAVTWSDPLGLTSERECRRATKQAQRTIDDAQQGHIRRSPDYHGRLDESTEQQILAHPESVFLSEGRSERLVFYREGNVVITETGSRRGQVVTSYGSSGPRGESGASIFGGCPSDPGLPISPADIESGQVPAAGGGTLPPARRLPI